MEQDKLKIEQDINRLRENAEKNGAIRYLPPASVVSRATEYIKDKIPYIREMLAPLLSPETLEAVIEDYALIFIGGYDFRATLAQMFVTLKAIKPPQAFYIDRYGLYFGLFINYMRILEVNTELVEKVLKNPNKTAQEKETELVSFYNQSPASHVMAAEWLLTNGFITANDFEGIPTKTVTGFLNACDVMGNISRYALLYYTTKHGLNTPPAELEAIPTPRLFKTHADGLAFAERTAQGLNEQMATMAAKVGALLNAETSTEREQIKQEVEQTVEDTAGASVKVNNTLSTILSRDIYSAYDRTATQIAPITKTITQAIKSGEVDTLTAYNIEKAVEGLQMLQMFERGVEQSDGRILYEVSISKFADRAHDRDATQEEKIAIIDALKLLNNLYLVAWKPNGKREAVAAVHLAKYEMDENNNPTGNLRITLDPKLTKGRPNLILLRDYKTMKKQAKRQTQNHFRNQILSKAQKEENALISEVFGYQRMRDETDGGAEQLRGVAEYIRKHKAKHRKQIIEMFDRYQQAGLLKYTRTENEKGEIIYKWRKSKTIKTDIAAAEMDDPDEQ